MGVEHGVMERDHPSLRQDNEKTLLLLFVAMKHPAETAD